MNDTTDEYGITKSKNIPKGIIEIVEAKSWLYKIRGTNRRKWYTLTKRKNGTFHCTCPSFLYNTDKCKHVKLLEMMVE